MKSIDQSQSVGNGGFDLSKPEDRSPLPPLGQANRRFSSLANPSPLRVLHRARRDCDEAARARSGQRGFSHRFQNGRVIGIVRMVGNKFQQSQNPLSTDSGIPFEEFVHGCTMSEIFKKCADRQSRLLKDPGAAHFAGHAFNLWTLRPIQHHRTITQLTSLAQQGTSRAHNLHIYPSRYVDFPYCPFIFTPLNSAK